jgi:hypothetical protein
MVAKRSGKRLSRHAFARCYGVSRQAVEQALVSGRLVETDRLLDPADPINAAWIERRRARAASPAPDAASAALAERIAGLRAREYELHTAHANTVQRDNVARQLRAEANEWRAVCTFLPTGMAEELAPLLQRPVEQVKPPLDRAMTAFLASYGDQHARIEEALHRIARRWPPPPLRRLDGPPPLFQVPGSMVEANARHAAVRDALAQIKIELHAGVRLHRGATDYAIRDLRLRWWQAVADEFAAGFGPTLLGTLGVASLNGTMHAFWMLCWEKAFVLLLRLWPELVHEPGGDTTAEARAAIAATSGVMAGAAAD